jgi:hypothetical protein
VLALLNTVLLAAAVQAAPGPVGPSEAGDTVAAAGPPGPASPETTGPVEVGPVATTLAEHDVVVELRGTPESMARQHAVAVASELTFLGTLEEMELLAEAGELVPIYGGPHYEVMDWVFPYGIPEVRTFVERLAFEYRQACGETMVVTSLTRPFSEQLPNSHQLSVHPAGMAVDLRIPQTPACRAFLDTRLLEKEAAGLLDVTHERSPPHYHVAVFPEPYVWWASTQPPLPGVGPEQELTPAPAPVPEEPRRGVLWMAVALMLLAGVWVAAGWLYSRSRRPRPPRGD